MRRSARAGLRRCRSCRFNTRTSRAGNDSGCRAQYWSRGSASGDSICVAHTHSFALSPGMSASLVELSRHSGATLFMTLLAAFKTLLYRLTRQTDILVGTDVANRNSQETEGMMGFFVNLLVLRTELCGGESFRDLLRRVRSLALEAYIHRDLPFDKLVSELQI